MLRASTRTDRKENSNILPRGSHRDNRHPIEFNANIIVPLPTKIGFGSCECVISVPNYNLYRMPRDGRRLHFHQISVAITILHHVKGDEPNDPFTKSYAPVTFHARPNC